MMVTTEDDSMANQVWCRGNIGKVTLRVLCCGEVIHDSDCTIAGRLVVWLAFTLHNQATLLIRNRLCVSRRAPCHCPHLWCDCAVFRNRTQLHNRWLLLMHLVLAATTTTAQPDPTLLVGLYSQSHKWINTGRICSVWNTAGTDRVNHTSFPSHVMFASTWTHHNH